jgi:hypothetical protein
MVIVRVKMVCFFVFFESLERKRIGDKVQVYLCEKAISSRRI